jgi:hypothetical protein
MVDDFMFQGMRLTKDTIPDLVDAVVDVDAAHGLFIFFIYNTLWVFFKCCRT